MAEQGIRDDEWRLQRIRPFDWYSVEYKRQAQRELQAKYWRVWSDRRSAVSVLPGGTRKAGRAAGHDGSARRVVASAIQTRSTGMRWPRWLVCIEEGNQKDLATQKLSLMQEFLAEHPDPPRSAQLADLRKSDGAMPGGDSRLGSPAEQSSAVLTLSTSE